ELTRRHRQVPSGALAVQILQEVVRDGPVEPVPQLARGLGPVVVAGRDLVLAVGGGGGRVGAHRNAPLNARGGLDYSSLRVNSFQLTAHSSQPIRSANGWQLTDESRKP